MKGLEAVQRGQQLQFATDW